MALFCCSVETEEGGGGNEETSQEPMAGIWVGGNGSFMNGDKWPGSRNILLFILFYFIFFFYFLGPYLRHMEVPGLGVELEL